MAGIAGSRRVTIDHERWVDGQLVKRHLKPFSDRLTLFAERSTGNLAWINGERLKPGERIIRNGDELLHQEPPEDHPLRVPDEIAEYHRERLKA